MARKPRVQFPGALYHVICRGNENRQEAIGNSRTKCLAGRFERLKSSAAKPQFRSSTLQYSIVQILPLSARVHLSAFEPGTDALSDRSRKLSLEQHQDNLVRIETAPVLGELAKSAGKARLAYLKFMAEGKATGHQPDYYDVCDQRFLGDERFVEKIEERVQGDREIAVTVIKATGNRH